VERITASTAWERPASQSRRSVEFKSTVNLFVVVHRKQQPRKMPAPRLLDTLKPLLPFIPRVEAPLGGRVDVTERAIWTAATLALYLSLLSFPLFGAHEQQQHGMDTPDAWAHLRNIVAAKRGTLGELGVVPVVTAAVGMQAAAAWGWLDVDFGRREDRAVFGAAQKGESD
jgi:protein transport protein SEC61 subunit alpha